MIGNWDVRVSLVSFVLAGVIGFLGLVVTHLIWEHIVPLFVFFLAAFGVFVRQPNVLSVGGAFLYAIAFLVFIAGLFDLGSLFLMPAESDGGGLWVAAVLLSLVRFSGAVIVAMVFGVIGYFVRQRTLPSDD